MGRYPKPDGQRRNRMPLLAPNMTTLRIGERASAVPAWPLSMAEPCELELWAKLWLTPQSVMWERLGWFNGVARYARLLSIAEAPSVTNGALLAETRQLEDRLGLSPLAMLRLRWQIVEDDQPALEVVPEPLDIRERLLANN